MAISMSTPDFEKFELMTGIGSPIGIRVAGQIVDLHNFADFLGFRVAVRIHGDVAKLEEVGDLVISFAVHESIAEKLDWGNDRLLLLKFHHVSKLAVEVVDRAFRYEADTLDHLDVATSNSGAQTIQLEFGNGLSIAFHFESTSLVRKQVAP